MRKTIVIFNFSQMSQSGTPSRLNSLLQYRFVKKDKSGETVGSSQETLPPSQTSTLPPATPEKQISTTMSTPCNFLLTAELILFD